MADFWTKAGKLIISAGKFITCASCPCGIECGACNFLSSSTITAFWETADTATGFLFYNGSGLVYSSGDSTANMFVWKSPSNNATREFGTADSVTGCTSGTVTTSGETLQSIFLWVVYDCNNDEWHIGWTFTDDFSLITYLVVDLAGTCTGVTDNTCTGSSPNKIFTDISIVVS